MLVQDWVTEKGKEDQIMCAMNSLVDDLQSSRSEILFDHSPESKKSLYIKSSQMGQYIYIHIKQIGYYESQTIQRIEQIEWGLGGASIIWSFPKLCVRLGDRFFSLREAKC